MIWLYLFAIVGSGAGAVAAIWQHDSGEAVAWIALLLYALGDVIGEIRVRR